MPVKDRAGQPDGKCNREQIAVSTARVKRCGKSAPAAAAMSLARQTPSGARRSRRSGGAPPAESAGCAARGRWRRRPQIDDLPVSDGQNAAYAADPDIQRPFNWEGRLLACCKALSQRTKRQHRGHRDFGVVVWTTLVSPLFYSPAKRRPYGGRCSPSFVATRILFLGRLLRSAWGYKVIIAAPSLDSVSSVLSFCITYLALQSSRGLHDVPAKHPLDLH